MQISQVKNVQAKELCILTGNIKLENAVLYLAWLLLNFIKGGIYQTIIKNCT